MSVSVQHLASDQAPANTESWQFWSDLVAGILSAAAHAVILVVDQTA